MIEDTNRNSQRLPPGWAWATIGEIAESINPGFPSGQHNQEGKGVPHLRPMNISAKGEIDLSEVKYVEATDYDRLMYGDVLFNNTNSPALVGKTTHIRQDTNWAYSNHMTRLRLRRDQADAAWVAHSLHYLFLQGFFRMNCRHHVNQASISSGFLAESVSIPVPPLPDQRRIVAVIEELFSDLDAGVAALKRVQANLKRYRASVLKAACEGRLVPTEAELARQESRAYEPADVLLERILAERRVRWEADHPGRKYVEPAAPETDGLPELPEGWCWVSLEQLASGERYALSSGPFGSALGTKDYQATGVPVIRGKNVKDGTILVTDMVYISEEKAISLARSVAAPDDLVVVAVGSSGQPAIVPGRLPRAVLSQNCNKLSLAPNLVKPGYVLTALQIGTTQSQLVDATTDTARPFLSLTNLKRTIIPLPPLTEQDRIVAEVERRLSVVGELEAAVAANLARAGRLRQAVLKRAFEGRLAPRNPDDEPAEA
jgi:type I restriction enzyme, S subunit